MGLDFDHRRVGEREDWRWTFALLAEVRAAEAPDAQLEEAFRTLAHLEDYRSVGPLTAMVEDGQLPERVRERASQVVCGFDDVATSSQCRHWWKTGDPVLMAHALRLMQRSEADIVAKVAGDERHPLQSLALTMMAFGYDEAEFQPIKIQALGHQDARVREAGAGVLLWDEAVGAEEALVSAASDTSSSVAAAVVNTLQYYPARRVLRTLADMREVEDDDLRSKVTESFEYLQGCFEASATFGDADQVELLRAWMAPISDLVRWPEKAQSRPAGGAPTRPARAAVPEATLMALLEEADGDWATKKTTLLNVDWDLYGPAERRRLAEPLVTHPDPFVRGVAALPLAAWSRSEELFSLTRDPSSWVRKSAMYSLRSVPRDLSIAERAWEFLTTTNGIAAHEALQTYVAHAPSEEPRQRLVGLVLEDRREIVRTTAIASLVELAAIHEVHNLSALLREPPAVSWAVHIHLLDACRKLGLSAPIDDLRSVDNLYLTGSIIALSCSSS
jgi:hypothetical protein